MEQIHDVSDDLSRELAGFGYDLALSLSDRLRCLSLVAYKARERGEKGLSEECERMATSLRDAFLRDNPKWGLEADKLGQNVRAKGVIVWPWSKWQGLSRAEVQCIADRAAVTFISDGKGHDLRFFEEA